MADFSLLGSPNFMQPALSGYMAGLQFKQQKHAQDALSRVQANPDDPAAQMDLAIWNPQASQAVLGMQDRQRAVQARTAAAGVLSAYAAPGGTAPALGAPAQPQMQAPEAPPQAPGPPGYPEAPAAPTAPPQPAQNTPPQELLQPGHPVTQGIGQAVSSGQMTQQQAIAEFAKYADPQQVEQMVGTLGKMDDLRRSRLSEASDALGAEAQALKSVPQANRMQAAMQALPQLAQHGVTAEMVQKADLSDAGLNGLIGQAVGTKALIDASQTDRQLGQGDQRIALDAQKQAEEKRHNLVEENKPVNTAFGNKLVNPQTGAVVYDPDGGGGDTFSQILMQESGGRQFDAAGRPLTSPKGAIGIAQIMPQTGPDAARMAGVPWDPARFASDPAYNAQLGKAYYQSLVQHYGGDEAKAMAAYNAGPGAVDKALKSGGDWLSKLPSETQNYVRNITARLNSGNGTVGGLTQDSLDMAAREGLANGGKVPQGYARNKAAQAAIQNKMAEIAKTAGMSVGDYIANGGGLKADQAGLQKMMGQAAQVGAAERAAGANADLAAQKLQAVGNGAIPLINGWKNWTGHATGNANVDAFSSAVSTFVNEYATVMGRGTPTDSLRAEGHSLLSRNQNPEQFMATINTMKQDMANRREGFEAERQSLLGRIRSQGNFGSGQQSGGAPIKVATADDYARVPSGAQYIDPHGSVRTKR